MLRRLPPTPDQYFDSRNPSPQPEPPKPKGLADVSLGQIRECKKAAEAQVLEVLRDLQDKTGLKCKGFHFVYPVNDLAMEVVGPIRGVQIVLEDPEL